MLQRFDCPLGLAQPGGYFRVAHVLSKPADDHQSLLLGQSIDRMLTSSAAVSRCSAIA